MIRHLPHDAIDKAQWDASLLQCPNRLWYARSTVLDAVSPGWEALIDEELGAIMPLTTRRKWGFHYLAQPFGVQQLGLFAPSSTPALQGAFLSAVPERFKLWDIFINSPAVNDAPTDIRLTERTNMVIKLDRSIGELRSHYTEGHARALRKEAPDLLHGTMDPDAFISFVLGSPQARQWRMDAAARKQFRALVELACTDGTGTVRCVTIDHVPVAAGLFVHWEGRTIFLKGLSLDAGRPVRAMHRLMDAAIAHSVGRAGIFDLAGGEGAGIRRFYAGFGAQPTVYLRAKVNRLPQPLRWYKQRQDGA